MNWHDVDLRWAYGELLGSIYRQTRSIDRAYDVLHDSLVRLALTGQRDKIVQPHAYLQVVVRSVLADHGRTMARLLPFPDCDEADDGQTHPDIAAARKIIADTVDPAAFAPSPEHMAALQQRLRALQRIMDCLPPRCREVFWLYRIEGYTQPEIAAKLGITLKVVERHVMRALIDIRAARETLE